MPALIEYDAPTDGGDIAGEHGYAYLGRLRDHASDTRHHHFREVRCFFNWLVDAGYLNETPFPWREEHPPPTADRAAVLCGGRRRAARGLREGPLGIRDRALLLALLDTGARSSKVVQLDLDLDLRTGEEVPIAIQHGSVRFSARGATKTGTEIGGGPVPRLSQRNPHADVRAMVANDSLS